MSRLRKPPSRTTPKSDTTITPAGSVPSTPTAMSPYAAAAAVPAIASPTFSAAPLPVSPPSRRATANEVVRLARMSTAATAPTARYARQPRCPVAPTTPMTARKASAAAAENSENWAMLKLVEALISSLLLTAAAIAPTRKAVMIVEGAEKKRPSTNGAADMPTGGVLRRMATATGQRSVMKKSTASPQVGSAYQVETTGSG